MPISRSVFWKISILLLFAFFFFASCSARVQILPEPVVEQTLFRSGAVCPSSWLCSLGKSGSLNFKGILNNKTGEKPLFVEYYVSSFEESFPIGISIKLDQTWHNLRKTSTDYGDTVRVVSILPSEIVDKVLAAKEIQFSFSSRDNTTTLALNVSDAESLKSKLKDLKERIDAQAKLSITNH
ncbi:hypothetical protein [Leptospira wolffii]|uniref:hypothetical protein n=1 Tax=Leptospira wolffii TaxID=409998 RepID=UPI0002F65EE6|nr:hypothetical protein [Leptospira wolffii]EPG67354.1 putative lipoprotein [Leptospira wolffii serovar Khorat str. Khorat-H2]